MTTRGREPERRTVLALPAPPLHLMLRFAEPAPHAWQLALVERLARRPGLRLNAVWACEPAADPTATKLLFALERILGRRSDTARSVTRASFAPYLDEALTRADLVLDFQGPLGGRPTPTWFMTFDGGFGEPAVISALVAGNLPLLEIRESTGLRVIATARPGTESAGVLAMLADVMQRTATFVATSLDGIERRIDDPDPAGVTLRPGTAYRRAAKTLAQAPKRALYRALCHAPHWRVGWRRVDGPGVADLLTMPSDAVWHDLPDNGSRFYADPFPVLWREKTFLFVEDFEHRLGRGVISAVEFDERGPCGAPAPVLAEPHHLSYPFVFEHDGAFWMVPESSAAGTIDLYRAARFPDEWRHERTLVSDLIGGDATLFQHDGRWWMMASVSDGGSCSDALHLWSAGSLHNRWEPHPANPVLVDIASARPAGRVVERCGRLLRPVQDCRRGYGAALALAEITRLDPDGYGQRVVATIGPGGVWPSRRLHTLNRAGGFEFIDGSALAFRRPFGTALRWAGLSRRV